jgi:hypothetical protein
MTGGSASALELSRPAQASKADQALIELVAVTAQVTENIYDTPTGRARLIPQGARLVGIYDSQVAFGQTRVPWCGPD